MKYMMILSIITSVRLVALIVEAEKFKNAQCEWIWKERKGWSGEVGRFSYGGWLDRR